MEQGFDCYRVKLPKGMNINEYALKLTHASESLRLAIRGSQWLFKVKAKKITTIDPGDSQPSDLPVDELSIEETENLPLLLCKARQKPSPLVVPLSFSRSVSRLA